MLTTSARRLPPRVLRSNTISQMAIQRPVQATLGLVSHPRILRHPAQVQVRTFFGLKDFLFGKPNDKQEDDADKVVEKMTPSSTKSDATPATSAAANDEPINQLVGSQDVIEYSVGKYARLADGSVLSSCGKTMVLATAVSSAASHGKRKDFLPLMVDYRVKYHAAGLIPDTARRSEMTGTDEEILQSRIIDRVIRPLFPRDYVDDTQILATVHSLDPENDPLVLAVNAASAALVVSNIPWNGPIGCVRVCQVDGQLLVNPTRDQRDRATMDVVYAATMDRTLMIEANGQEISEQRMAEVLKLAHNAIQPLIRQQEEMAQSHGKPKRSYPKVELMDEIMTKAKEIGKPLITTALKKTKQTKSEREANEKEVHHSLLSELQTLFPDADSNMLEVIVHDVFHHFFRTKVLEASSVRLPRLDGRWLTTIRHLGVETDVLPMAHGSSIFTRGDTQSLCSVTLGPLDQGLRVKSAAQNQETDRVRHAILHYEFPPYCVNETGRVGGLNRRMVGHGALAEKAILPILPSINEFPYTIRMTAETMGSDGSSSMATVCGVTMALMDAGVPIKAPVAGISIGLVTEGDPFDGTKPIEKYKLLTDILGVEDHYGDMDFKVAGTETGITAMQLDVKLPGIPIEILIEAMTHAKRARSFILKRMALVLPTSRTDVQHKVDGVVQHSLQFRVPITSISSIIGVGGSNIRSVESTTRCAVSIDRRSGDILVVGPVEKLEEAKTTLLGFVSENFYKVGERYSMKVVELLDFGAILESTAPTKNRGFVHISELSSERVKNMSDVLTVGQILDFQCLTAGSSGKMSLKALSAGTTDENTNNRPVSGTGSKFRRSKHVTSRSASTTTP